jgi:hypothetical protein
MTSDRNIAGPEHAMIEIRCSSLDRALACPASITPPAIRIEGDRGPAELGTDVHARIAGHILGHEPRDIHRSEEEEELFDATLRCWEKIKHWYPDPVCEQALDRMDNGLALTGHPDLVSGPHDGELRILDWKTGRLESDCIEQMRGYAFLSLYEREGVERVTVQVVRPRQRKAVGYPLPGQPAWTYEYLRAWWDRLVERLTTEQDRYTPGPHCQHCPRRFECPARQQMVSSYVSEILENDGGSPPTQGEKLVRAYEVARMLEKVAADVRGFVKDQITLTTGQLVEGERMQLTLAEKPRRTITEADLAIKVLSEFAPEDQFQSACKLGIGDAEKVLSNAAPRGLKKKLILEAMRALDHAGLIETKTHMEVVLSPIERITADNSPKQLTAAKESIE